MVRRARHARHAVVQSGELSQVGAGGLRGETGRVQDTYAGGLRRARLSRSVHAVAGIFQRVAAAGCAVKARGIPGRRPLGAETAERAVLVQDVLGLAGAVDEMTPRSSEQALEGSPKKTEQMKQQERRQHQQER